MKHIYTYSFEKTQRNLTLPDIRACKRAGYKMTQATAESGVEAAAVEAAGIDMLGLGSTRIAYMEAVANGSFPDDEFSVGMLLGEYEKLSAELDKLNGAVS